MVLPEARWQRVSDFAKRHGLSKNFVYSLAAKGILRSLKVGGRVLIDKHALDLLAEAQTARKSQQTKGKAPGGTAGAAGEAREEPLAPQTQFTTDAAWAPLGLPQPIADPDAASTRADAAP